MRSLRGFGAPALILGCYVAIVSLPARAGPPLSFHSQWMLTIDNETGPMSIRRVAHEKNAAVFHLSWGSKVGVLLAPREREYPLVVYIHKLSQDGLRLDCKGLIAPSLSTMMAGTCQRGKMEVPWYATLIPESSAPVAADTSDPSGKKSDPPSCRVKVQFVDRKDDLCPALPQADAEFAEHVSPIFDDKADGVESTRFPTLPKSSSDLDGWLRQLNGRLLQTVDRLYGPLMQQFNDTEEESCPGRDPLFCQIAFRQDAIAYVIRSAKRQ